MNKKRVLPEKTVERLSQYRRALQHCPADKTHVFSHELANMLNITAVQVRRDIMLMGYSGQLRKGYEIAKLTEAISQTIDHSLGKRVAVVGAGKLGRAIVGYFSERHPKLSIAACFDIDPMLINTKISGIHCFPMQDLEAIIAQEQIELAILTVPQSEAVGIATKLSNAGIKGILNYTSSPLKVADNVFLEEYDMTTSLEKLAYFSDRL